MKETIKKAIVFWLVSSVTILLVGFAYAAITTVNSWDTLTATKFNEVINATNGTSGTWTASLKWNSNPSNVDLNSINASVDSTGIYYKVWNMVFVNAHFDVSAYSNHIFYRIEWLPFTASQQSNLALWHLRWILWRYNTTTYSSFQHSAYIGAGNTKIDLQTANYSTLQSGYWYVRSDVGGKFIHVSWTYITND